MDREIPVERMKPGTIFEHRHWLDCKNMPLLCRVTAVRGETVYWREWVPKDQAAKGNKYCFDLDQTKKYVGSVLQTEAV